MRLETTTRKILTWNELNEEQKTKVIEKLSDINILHDWYEYSIVDFTEMLKMLGFYDVKIQFSGFWSQGDGASFTGKFKVPSTKKELKERVKKLRLTYPRQKVFNYDSMNFTKEEKQDEILEVFRITSFYSHENTISADNNDLKEFARDFSREIYKSLENEYNYLTSREAIIEAIEANDYEFYEDTLTIA